MINDIKNVFTRSDNSLAQDFIGAAALVVMLAVALYVPNLV